MGLMLRVLVHPANLQDRDEGQLLLAEGIERFPRLAHLWADGTYQGPFAEWVTETLGWSVTLVRKRRRWVRVAGGRSRRRIRSGSNSCHSAGWWSGRSAG